MGSGSMWLSLSAVAIFGFTGSLHCLGMCGPLAAASCRTKDAARQLSGVGVVVYLLVRLVSYGMLGFAAGIVGAVVLREGLSLQSHHVSSAFAALMLMWALVDLGRGLVAISQRRPPVPLAAHLRGARSLRTLPWLLALPIPSSVALGLATAILPCGFLAAAYVQAALLSNPVASSLAMVVFALATSPALLGGAFVSMGLQRWMPRYAPLLGSVFLLLASLLLLQRSASSKHEHHCHQLPIGHEHKPDAGSSLE